MDALQLHRQLLKGRETKVTIGRMSFTLRRPTEMELIRLRTGENRGIEVNLALLQSHVIGWDGVNESDVVPGGAQDVPVEFNQALYSAWIEDRTDLWAPIANKLGEVIEAHEKQMELHRGN